MDVIYYYCYLFYKKILKEDEPHALTVWALGCGEGFLTNALLYSFLVYFFCIKTLNIWIMMSIVGLFVFANYRYFYKSGRAKKIEKEKPMFFSSRKISILITIIFFTVLISSIFWGPFLIKYLKDTYCR